MLEDSNRVSIHSIGRTPSRDNGSVHSSSIKSQLISIKSERPPSVKMEASVILLPGSSVGDITTASVKSESASRGSSGALSSAPWGRELRMVDLQSDLITKTRD